MDIKSKHSSDITQTTMHEVRSNRNQEQDLNKSQKSVSDRKPAGGYQVNISPESVRRQEEQQKAYQIAQDTSPTREDRIEHLKHKISSGNYKIDSGKIADGILREAIREYLANHEFSGET
ncbi:MAG: flagellar biosynthesis anti-sigma factor FlgM [Deltaproteobacteria bacterium]|nr:flagellar biosynthesis anti-sigma factor FlgM [Deltaproteobacteria bacterium]